MMSNMGHQGGIAVLYRQLNLSLENNQLNTQATNHKLEPYKSYSTK